MPVRILHVLDSLGNGGLENGVVNLVRHMDASRFEHVICTVRESGVNAVRLPAGRARLVHLGKCDRRWQVPELRRVIRDTAPDVVHSRNWGAIEAVFAAHLSGGCAIIHSEHGLEARDRARMPWRRTCVRRLAFELADQVLCVSRQLRAVHGRHTGFPARRMLVIHNGVDTVRYVPDQAARERMRREMGIGSDVFCLGAVGNLAPVKGHLTLLRGLAELGSAVAGWRVLVAGEGPERPKLEAAARDLPRPGAEVTLLGTSTRVPELLNAFDAYVLPSVNEGISNSLLEAMASGLPLVASDAGGNPEVVEDGSSGLLFRAGDARGLAECLLRIYSSPERRKDLGAAARRRVLDDFSIGSMLGSYERLYLAMARASEAACAEVGR
jgi:sugar transferase (PEP-CTERM/EpsH1 system associated)